ncbi:MAG: type I-D CRISPR-associated endonuclease Cas1, partial [Caldilineaceae bacterium]|nr:type I-D CRISPR-associated endonuclease Cas1 [Caldilineaceae bacterium]
MTTLYLTEPRSVVRKDGDTLAVKIPANKETGAAERTVRIPLLKVDQVVVLGDSTVTTPALLALLQQNADICFCDYGGRFQGRLTPSVSKNVFVRAAQFRSHEAYPRRVALAARFVRGKLHNERTLLLRSHRSLQEQDLADVVAGAAETLGNLIREVDRLEVEEEGPLDPARPQLQSALGALQGLEGAGAAAFFRGFRSLLKQDLGFTGRHRRPPTDPVNSLLSFGYTLLMNQVLSAVQIVGFDPYIGYLHSQGYGKPALALDLMEEMRTPIVDSVVLTVVNKQILQPKHFDAQLGVYQLTPAGRKLFLQQFEARLNTEIQHPVFGYKASYRRCLELQARLLAKSLLGEIPAYRPFQIR